MDEATRPGSEAVGTDERKSPDELRQDIERTRGQLGDTVEALAEKADVKARAQAKADDAKEKVTARKDEVFAKVAASTPEDAKSTVQQAAQRAQAKPVPLAVGAGFVAGLVIGRLTAR